MKTRFIFCAVLGLLAAHLRAAELIDDLQIAGELTFSSGADFDFSAADVIGTLAIANGGTGATSASAARTALGLAIGTHVQAYDADLDTWSGITPSADIQSFLAAADYAAARTALGVEIGADVQAYDADLDTWSGITPSANVQSLLAAADYAAIRALLDLEPGTDYIAVPGSSAEGDLLYRDSSGWTRLPKGTNGQVLKSTSTSLTWGTDNTGGGGGGGGSLTLARFTATDNQPPATNYATFDTRNSIAVLDFDADTDEAAVFVGIVPEGADFTTGITVTIIWTAAATSGDVIWTSAFERGNTDLDSDSFASAVVGSAATTNSTSGIPSVTSIDHDDTEIDDINAGDLFRLKITRDADNGSDTMTGDAEIIAVEVRQR